MYISVAIFSVNCCLAAQWDGPTSLHADFPLACHLVMVDRDSRAGPLNVGNRAPQASHPCKTIAMTQTTLIVC